MSTLQIALLIATLISAVSPLLLKYIQLDGNQMAAASYLASTLVALLAGYASGQLHWPPTWETLGVLLTTGSWLWVVQQAVYRLLNANQTTAPLVN